MRIARRFFSGLAASGWFKQITDQTYTAEQIADACRYVETEQDIGSVIITF